MDIVLVDERIPFVGDPYILTLVRGSPFPTSGVY